MAIKKNKNAQKPLQTKAPEPEPAPIAAAASPKLDLTASPKMDLTKEYKTAHYSASVQAWFGTKMEKDKSLLTLASAGIAILAQLGASSRVEKIFCILTIAFLIITIFCSLIVFEINAKLIESLIREKNTKSTGKVANFLDHVLVLSFLFGVISFAMLGIARFMNW